MQSSADSIQQNMAQRSAMAVKSARSRDMLVETMFCGGWAGPMVPSPSGNWRSAGMTGQS